MKNDKQPEIKNKIAKIKNKELTLEAVFKAYYDCRKHKRHTAQAIEFEYKLEKNLINLYTDLQTGSYKIGRSICFIVTEPKIREVWAGAFRDRIVHHIVYNAIKERFENRFIKDTFSCIPKRGTLAGAKRAEIFARKITKNYTQKAYFLQADISNYFNSIDKNILFKEIEKFVKEDWLLALIKQIVFHNPRQNVYVKSPKELWENLPKHKSLFNTAIEKGIPIGNLTSQFFSNVYLNKLDQFVKHKLKIKYYCRYVDDVILMHEDVKYLNHAYEEMDKFLQKNLELHFNPRKKNINLVDKGFDFVGHVIKPNRRHIRTLTLKKCLKIIKKWKNNKNRFQEDVLEDFRNKVNSYLGMLKHVNSYNLRKKICIEATTLFTQPDENYGKIIIVKNKNK